MKRPVSLISLLLASTLLLNFPLVACAEQTKLPGGTVVRLKLLQTLSSKTNHEGDSISFQVVGNVVGPDKKSILIKDGAPAYGTISRVEKNGAVGKQGELGMSVDRAQAVDGTMVPLRANQSSEGRSKVGSTVALGVVTGIIFLPGFLFLMKHGKDAVIPTGAELDAYVNSDVLVDVSGATPAVVDTPLAQPASAEAKTPDYLQKYADASKEAPKKEESADAPQADNLKQLETLGRLRKQGIITEAEFQAKKKQLLGL